MGGDNAVLQGFLALIKKELCKSLIDIENCIREKDLKLLKDAGHKLKGTGLSGGMPGLTVIADEINKLAEFSETVVIDLLTRLQTEINHIIPLLDKEIETLYR